MAKSHHASFPIIDSKATLPFDLIHFDVWGLAKVSSNGFHWFVFLMKNKSDVSLLLQEFCVMMSTQFQTKVKIFSSDNGGEYRSKLDACTLRCVFIGYANNQKGYKYSDRSTVIPETISTEDRSDVPNELPVVGMSNELPDDGSSNDDSSNGLFDVKSVFLHGDLKEEVYIDLPPDIGISPEKGVVCRLQKTLYATEFEMKELGELKYFLGIEVARSKHGIFLSQRKYFMHSPNEAHMDAVIRILRYLKMAPRRGLVFSKNGHLNVKGKKLNVVARSSAEAEFSDQLIDVLTKITFVSEFQYILSYVVDSWISPANGLPHSPQKNAMEDEAKEPHTLSTHAAKDLQLVVNGQHHLEALITEESLVFTWKPEANTTPILQTPSFLKEKGIKTIRDWSLICLQTEINFANFITRNLPYYRRKENHTVSRCTKVMVHIGFLCGQLMATTKSNTTTKNAQG
ncbi:hypothetical protein D8674_012068 [Pyrus ussuriensis x Pyrus communis]|uniref:Retroviral polymerase SH3-like domain-containing protein n=1 Tax=Pyrus ussuriensis x Pyrus communis TaxID=2448454 RepID=A0A5N5G591_9ROSA|nr:hypothetical protein D8674_012068 [Pyrus ussuriensis x Pyrus communis]